MTHHDLDYRCKGGDARIDIASTDRLSRETTAVMAKNEAPVERQQERPVMMINCHMGRISFSYRIHRGISTTSRQISFAVWYVEVDKNQTFTSPADSSLNSALEYVL